MRNMNELVHAVQALQKRVEALEQRLDLDQAEREEGREIMGEIRAKMQEIQEKGTLGPEKPAPKVKPGKRPDLMAAAGVGKDPKKG